MHVFEIWASSSSPRLPLCQILFFATSFAELAHGQKSCTQSLTESLTYPFDEPETRIEVLERKQRKAMLCTLYKLTLRKYQ